MTFLKKKKVIALMFGGKSTEHEVSLRSSIDVAKAIDYKKYNVLFIGIDKLGKWHLYENKKFLKNILDFKKISLLPSYDCLSVIPGKSRILIIKNKKNKNFPKIDLVFSVLHGSYGEDGAMQGTLEILNIPYVGSNVLSSAVCMDKDITKRIINSAGITATPSFTIFQYDFINRRKYDFIIKKLGLPLIVKPVKQGSSIGVSQVENKKEFISALKLAFKYGNKVLVEKKIFGKEIEIAIIQENFKLKFSVCGEVKKNDQFYTYNNKYHEKNGLNFMIPARIGEDRIHQLQKISKKIFFLLNCQTMARISFFLDIKNNIFFNEINTIPGISSSSIFSKLWKASGLNYSILINKLIDLSLNKRLIN